MFAVALASGAIASGASIEPPPAERTNRSSPSGAWLQHGDYEKLTSPQFGFVLGVDAFVSWDKIEPKDGKFDFSFAESQFAPVAAAGFRIQTALATGSQAPSWILAKGVKVKMGDGHSCSHTAVEALSAVESSNATSARGDDSGSICTWPDYLDPFYQDRLVRAVEKFAEWLASSKFKQAVVSSQVMFGSTGDDTPYHGTPVDETKKISKAQWENLTVSLAPAICKSYTSRGIDPLWNSKSYETLLDLCPGSDLKLGQISHGYQETGEADRYQAEGAYCREEGYHCRGETWAFSRHGDYAEAPLWVTYAHNNWLLTFGLDLPGFSENTLAEPSFAPLYRLFNKYATSIRPPVHNWIGAILQLRDGLDSANSERFPESKYGKAFQSNGNRMQKIAESLAHRGATLGDVAAATANAEKSRSPKKMNDVGWRIWEGNYGNGLLTQLAPLETSGGIWQIGPKDQCYGRFARQFNTAMGFVLAGKLWGGLPMSGTQVRPLVLSVVYFDGAPPGVKDVAQDATDEGSTPTSLNKPRPKRTLVIAYDGQQGCTSTSVSVGNTQRWKVWNKTITDGKFGKSCSGTKTKADGADIMLRSDGGTMIAISTLEIYDPNGPF